MNRTLPLFSALALATASAFAAPLDPVLSGDNLWTQKQEEFMNTAKDLGFTWTSAARATAPAPRPLTANAVSASSSAASTAV